MSFWTFVFLVSLAGMIFTYLMRSKELKHGANPDASKSHHGKGDSTDAASLQAIENKLDQMEQRLQSLETIVIEGERHREFDNALNR